MVSTKKAATVVSTAMFVLLTTRAVHAGGFSLYTEASGVAIANYAAGIAAEAIDASTGWYNPAGLVLIDKQQFVLNTIGVFPSSKLSGNSTYATQSFPPYSQSINRLQGGKNAVVPSLHYALPLTSQAVFGLSILSPFGLSTEYDQNSPIRYAATTTELLTMNIAPELGLKLSEHYSVGVGLDWQWAQVKFNSMLGSPASLQWVQHNGNPNLYPTYYDSLSFNKGHSTGVGFHSGLMAMFNHNHTRLGLNYQSKIKHTFHGVSRLIGRLADPSFINPMAVFRSDSLSSNDINLPAIITLSAYHDLNDKWALLASVVYTGWDVFKVIKLSHVAAISSNTLTPATIDVINSENYRNSWRFAVGANYKFNQQWMLRLGGGYDQTPTIYSARDSRLPDANRWALSTGLVYQLKPNLSLGIGYSYLFAGNDTQVNKMQLIGSASSYHVNAKANVHAHLLGLQLAWTY
ncbi:MAG: OmpP1/FadL family transporter [Legionella sp.]